MAEKLKPADMMPGSFGLPFIGQTIGILAKQELFYWQQYQQYGNIFKISLPEAMGYGKCACLIGPEANQLVLKDAADKLSSRLGNRSLEPILSKDLVLLQDGAEHRASRKLILPMFHHQAIASYFDTIQSVVTETVASWGEQGTINLEKEMRKLTLAIAIRTFLGSSKTEEIDRVSQWYVTLLGSLNGMVKWDSPLTFYGRGQAARRNIAEYIRQIIKDRIELGDLEKSKDVIGFLMSVVDEDGNKFTEAQIINQAIGFLFAAHETTSSLMSWLMFELGNRPEWRQKLRAELQQVARNEPLKLQQLRQLPQMSNVLKEGERLYPPAGMSRAVVEDIEYAGYIIPAGWYVLIFPHMTHRMPEIYKDPDAFDPDRFAPPREEDKKYPYSLIGFGGGAHSCIGVEFANMEMKIILSTLLQKYDWTVTPSIDEIAPVRKPFSTQKKLIATFVKIPSSEGIF
ncbi:cytochrome P450 [Chamaesiphon sp. VAR_48_metabat_403]|uniref:cytochrome P450 n=1 Tax=Chamaesiphon sp. VAR_48_metabat_403 TaxID=2964700 RepID=UPI00286E5464|nr:cytochrome P450 [Chamaesiphon sp. VAR_48_metabat_403]